MASMSLEDCPFSDVTEANRYFSKFFKKTNWEIFDFPKNPKEVKSSQIC